MVAESSVTEPQGGPKITISSIGGERNALRTDGSFLQRSPEEVDGAVRRLKISNESSRHTLQYVAEELDEKRSGHPALQAQLTAEVQRSAALRPL